MFVQRLFGYQKKNLYVPVSDSTITPECFEFRVVAEESWATGIFLSLMIYIYLFNLLLLIFFYYVNAYKLCKKKQISKYLKIDKYIYTSTRIHAPLVRFRFLFCTESLVD